VVIERISAVTLAVRDMARAVRFYQTLGFKLRYGGEAASFSSFQVGIGYLNLVLAPAGFSPSWWGRVIFYVEDVDALYRRLVDAGLSPSTTPEDASWGERYFHINDPDGHELSFARPLGRRD
jgi:catechol 2,3-dioxygenase-like lactoylglutathione lyase family enzyme